MRTKLGECGWDDETRMWCTKQVKLDQKLTPVTIDTIISEVTPHATTTVPLSIKIEVLEKIKEFLITH